MVERVGRYRILERLGAGGMGVVFRAEDVVLRRSVALKFLSAAMASDEEYRARFLREARVAAGLNHPNTCTVYEVGEVGAGEFAGADGIVEHGTPFIAMELVDGETLADRLARGGALPARTAIGLALQLAAGLAEAHAAHVVHRDLKPQNVMITSGGRVKVVDFGLAKPLRRIDGGDRVTTSEMISVDLGEVAVAGTCAYMSPEQATGRPLDARSDVFSFGIVLYEMITGQRPFRGDTATEVIARILEGEPEPIPGSLNVPRALERLVARCLRKRPEERPADAQELVRELRAVEAALEESRSWRRRLARPALAGSAVVALVLGYLLVMPGGAPNPVDANPPDTTPTPAAVSATAPDATRTSAPDQASGEPGVAADIDRPDVPTPAPTPQAPPSAAEEPRAETAPASGEGAGPSVRQPEAAPPAPEPEPAPVATLFVTSTPAASVSVDGDLRGITPLTIEATPGSREIVLMSPDGLRWRGRLDVAAGESGELHRDLTATGGLSINSDVWAWVRVDDGPGEQTPVHFPDLAAGLHRLQAWRDGYVTQVLEVFIEEGDTTSVRIALERQP